MSQRHMNRGAEDYPEIKQGRRGRYSTRRWGFGVVRALFDVLRPGGLSFLLPIAGAQASTTRADAARDRDYTGGHQRDLPSSCGLLIPRGAPSQADQNCPGLADRAARASKPSCSGRIICGRVTGSVWQRVVLRAGSSAVVYTSTEVRRRGNGSRALRGLLWGS